MPDDRKVHFHDDKHPLPFSNEEIEKIEASEPKKDTAYFCSSARYYYMVGRFLATIEDLQRKLIFGMENAQIDADAFRKSLCAEHYDEYEYHEGKEGGPCTECTIAQLTQERDAYREAIESVASTLEPIDTVKVACGNRIRVDAAHRIGRARIALDKAIAKYQEGAGATCPPSSSTHAQKA